jgi:hypothetical protein
MYFSESVDKKVATTHQAMLLEVRHCIMMWKAKENSSSPLKSLQEACRQHAQPPIT